MRAFPAIALLIGLLWPVNALTDSVGDVDAAARAVGRPPEQEKSGHAAQVRPIREGLFKCGSFRGLRSELTYKQLKLLCYFLKLAEGVGFEPTLRFPGDGLAIRCI